MQRLEVIANVKSPICLYKFEIRHAEIVFSDACIEEYIPLGTLSPAAISSSATTEMQHSDIQHSDHEIETDCTLIRSAYYTRGGRNTCAWG